MASCSIDADYDPSTQTDCQLNRSVIIALWCSVLALYLLLFAYALRVALGVCESRRVTLRNFASQRPGTRTPIMVLSLSVAMSVLALFKISSGFPPICVDVGVSIPYAITLILIFVNAQNSLLAYGSAAMKCTLSGAVNFSTMQRVFRGYILLAAQTVWPIFVAFSSPRGSDRQLLWSRVHMTFVGAVFCVFGFCLCVFIPQLRRAIRSTLAAKLGQEGTRQTESLKLLDNNLTKLLRLNMPAHFLISILLWIVTFLPSAIVYMSYILPCFFIMGAFLYTVILARSKALINLESPEQQRALTIRSASTRSVRPATAALTPTLKTHRSAVQLPSPPSPLAVSSPASQARTAAVRSISN